MHRATYSRRATRTTGSAGACIAAAGPLSVAAGRRTRTTGSSAGTAIKDRPAALHPTWTGVWTCVHAGPGRRSPTRQRRSRASHWRWRCVDRARPSLRHNDAPCRSSCQLRGQGRRSHFRSSRGCRRRNRCRGNGCRRSGYRRRRRSRCHRRPGHDHRSRRCARSDGRPRWYSTRGRASHNRPCRWLSCNGRRSNNLWCLARQRYDPARSRPVLPIGRGTRSAPWCRRSLGRGWCLTRDRARGNRRRRLRHRRSRPRRGRCRRTCDRRSRGRRRSSRCLRRRGSNPGCLHRCYRSTVCRRGRSRGEGWRRRRGRSCGTWSNGSALGTRRRGRRRSRCNNRTSRHGGRRTNRRRRCRDDRPALPSLSLLSLLALSALGGSLPLLDRSQYVSGL